MNDGSKVREQLRMIEERASKDKDFLNYLNEIEAVIDMECKEHPSADNARSRLPYSSEPPVSEATWN